ILPVRSSRDVRGAVHSVRAAHKEGALAMPRLIMPLMLGLVVMVLASRTRATDKPAGQAVLLVANKGARTVSVIDPSSGQQLAAVAEGGESGHEVVASPGGRTAYVPIYGNSGVGKPGTDG